MHRSTILAIATALSAGALHAAPPTALTQVTGGLWEIIGAQGKQVPVRQCVGDILTFGQFEHRSRTCSRTIVSDKASSTVINYSCGPADFGESQIDVLTPRSLRISTQGISGQLPFNYVLEAHRVGDCAKGPAAPRH